LIGAPKIVRNFICKFNTLTSLEGAPEIVEGYFDCSYSQLTSLEGAPEIVNGDFDCSSNYLTSLKGCPKTVKGAFYCNDNKLQNLEYLSENVVPKTLISDFSKEKVFEFFRSNRPEMLI
jgi:hypothetical protein